MSGADGRAAKLSPESAVLIRGNNGAAEVPEWAGARFAPDHKPGSPRPRTVARLLGCTIGQIPHAAGCCLGRRPTSAPKRANRATWFAVNNRRRHRGLIPSSAPNDCSTPDDHVAPHTNHVRDVWLAYTPPLTPFFISRHSPPPITRRYSFAKIGGLRHPGFSISLPVIALQKDILEPHTAHTVTPTNTPSNHTQPKHSIPKWTYAYRNPAHCLHQTPPRHWEPNPLQHHTRTQLLPTRLCLTHTYINTRRFILSANRVLHSDSSKTQ